MPRNRGHNIEDDFVEAMRTIGGKRPDEIDPACARTKNADIVFPNEDVIAEVKTLMEDSRDQKDFKTKYGAMYARWAREGRVPPKVGTHMIDTSKLPRECAHEFLRHVTRGVGGHVKKSNRQIRQLKKTLSMPSAKGLLVLCNSGNAFLQPDVLLYGLHHCLAGRFSSIDWLIYFTYQLPIQQNGIPQPPDLFTQPVREGFEGMPTELFRRILDAWMRHRSSGTMVTVYDGGDHRRLQDVKHLDPQEPVT